MFSATTTENIKGFLTIARGRVRTKTNWRALSSSAAVRVAGANEARAASQAWIEDAINKPKCLLFWIGI